MSLAQINASKYMIFSSEILDPFIFTESSNSSLEDYSKEGVGESSFIGKNFISSILRNSVVSFLQLSSKKLVYNGGSRLLASIAYRGS